VGIIEKPEESTALSRITPQTMPNPKRRHSKTRTAKRRTHQKAGVPAIHLGPHTGETHLRHRAYKVGDDLYYNGKLVVSSTDASE
jgi:large subunit ribosomal protein L32